MNERNEQLKAVLSDEAFVRSLLEAENEEAVQKMLADKGVEMSLTEIELMGEALEGLKDGRITEEDIAMLTKEGELSEDELENAAGGSMHDFFYKMVECTKTFGDNSVFTGKMEVLQTNRVAAAIGIGVAAVAGIGYGIYDAVRRRW